MKLRSLTAILLALLLALTMFSGLALADEAPEEEAFAQWNADAPALNALIEYVEDVIDPDSLNFIPEMPRRTN